MSGVEQEGETTVATVTTSSTCLGHNEVYDFSVSIEGGQWHMVGAAFFQMPFIR